MADADQGKRKSQGEAQQGDPLWAVLENTFDAALLADGEGRILQSNHTFETLIGKSGSRFKKIQTWAKKGFSEQHHADKFLQAWADCVTARETHEGEYRLTSEVQAPLWAKIKIIPFGDERVVIMIRDYSQTWQATGVMRHAGFAVEHANDAFFLLGKDGRVIAVNAAACSALQYSREELLGLHVWDYDPRYPEAVWKKGWGKAQKQKSLRSESLHQRKDGTTFPVELSVNYLVANGTEYLSAFARDITAQKAFGEALRETEAVAAESQRSFQNTMAATPLGAFMYRLEADGRLIFMGANRAADRILGVKNQQFIGKTIEEAFPPLAATEVPDAYRRVAKTGKAWHTEQIDYDDERIRGAFEVHAFQTTPGHMVCMFSDITERKRAEKALQNSEERYRRVSEITSDFAYGFKVRDGKTLQLEWVTGALSEITGYDQAELVAHGGRESIIHPDDQAAARRQRLQLLAGKSDTAEYRVITKNNETRYVRDIAKPIWDRKKKQTTFIYGAVKDITKRTQAREELTRLATAVNQAAESIVITTVDGTIVYANPYFEKMTGHKIKDVIGKNPRILKSGKHDQPFYENLWQTITSGKTWRGVFINRKKNGELFEEKAAISPVMDNAGNIVHFVAVKRDVTQERVLETQVRQSQKMAAIGQLAHKVTHSFTNVLMMILGNAQLAKDQVKHMPQAAQHMEEVIQAANRVSALTAELLSFAHPAPLVLKALSLDKALLGLADILHPTISQDVQLKIKLGKTPKVNLDPGQIEQAVVHLAINAVEAMPDGGELLIETGVADLSPDDAAKLQMSVLQAHRHEGDFAMIKIQDHGKGITEEELSHIYEPFFTTKPDKHNAGLGLSTVYSIIDQHNGHIVIDSTPGQGTTVRIYLPVVA